MVIQELLELEPESKCESFRVDWQQDFEVALPDVLSFTDPSSPTWILIGCLDSLVYYQRVLMSSTKDTEQTAALKKACMGHLEKLQKVDALRSNRYKDLARDLIAS